MDNIFKKFIEFGLGNIIVLILGFLSSPIITRIIMPEEFGKYSMFSTVTSLIAVVTLLGLDQAYMRFFYEEEEENRPLLMKKMIKVPIILNIVIGIILLVFYKNISKLIIGEESIFFIIIMVIYNFILLLVRFSSVIIRMQQKSKIYSYIQVINKMIYILGALALFNLFNSDYRTLILAIVISNIVSACISIYIENEYWIKIKLKNKKLNTSTNTFIAYGIPLVFATALNWVFESSDRIIINSFCGYIELGLYSAAMSIVGLLNTFQNTFTTFWVPIANEKFKYSSKNKEFFIKANYVVNFIMFSIGIILITFKDIIIILLGEKYRVASYIFPFLVFMPIMYTISETTVIGINFKKKTKYHVLISSIVASINILGNIILIPKIGAKGAAISTGISYIVLFIMRTLISKKMYSVKYKLNNCFINIMMLLILSLYATFGKNIILLILLGSVIMLINLYLHRNLIYSIFNLIKCIISKNKIECIK